RVYMFDNQTEKFIDILGSVAETMITNNYADHIYTLSKGISWMDDGERTKINCLRSGNNYHYV
ncbi:hypothetical protein, partial [Bacteroides thetaiotaomicron]